MQDPRVDKLANVLIHHSCRLKAGQKVLIEAFDLPEPNLAGGRGAQITAQPDVVSRRRFEGVLPTSRVRVVESDGGVPSRKRGRAGGTPVSIRNNIRYRSDRPAWQDQKSANQRKS